MTGESVMVYCWIASSTDDVCQTLKGSDTSAIKPPRGDVAYQGIKYDDTLHHIVAYPSRSIPQRMGSTRTSAPPAQIHSLCQPVLDSRYQTTKKAENISLAAPDRRVG